MDFRLRLPDDPDSELKQLYDWLIRDRDVHRDADISLRADGEATSKQDEDGENSEDESSDTSMGDAVDIVQLVLDTGFQLASLGVAIVAWRRAQRPRSPVVIERNGFHLTVPAGATEDEVTRLLEALANTRPNADPPQPSDDPPDRPPEDPEDSPPTPGTPPPEGDDQ